MASAFASSEGRPDPFWSDPREEHPRTARVFAAIQGIGEAAADGYKYAGIAAFGRNPANVVAVIMTSAKDDAVLWEYVFDAERGARLVHYWLCIAPASRAERLGIGNASL